MDPSAFDTLARSIAQTGTRRWLLPRLAAAALLGVLAHGDEEEAGAERPSDRVQDRTKQRNKKQRNKRRRNKNNNGGGGGKLSGPGSCLSNGNICAQDSDCCSNNCFNFVCAARVTECSQGGATRQCVPPAKGCAGGACCYGAAACGDTCCEGQANQCNPQGACCAPNCAGRQCGPDGCGAGGTCGNCQQGQACNETTGQCQGSTVCSAQTCATGCCDASGTCRQGGSLQVCGTGGAPCKACPSAPVNGTATCSNGTCAFTCDFESCGSTCCPSNQHCDPDGCCGFIGDSCTEDSECCAHPQNFCKTVGSSRFCCAVSGVDPCSPQTADRCCSGQCGQDLTCA